MLALTLPRTHKKHRNISATRMSNGYQGLVYIYLYIHRTRGLARTLPRTKHINVFRHEGLPRISRSWSWSWSSSSSSSSSSMSSSSSSASSSSSSIFVDVVFVDLDVVVVVVVVVVEFVFVFVVIVVVASDLAVAAAAGYLLLSLCLSLSLAIAPALSLSLSFSLTHFVSLSLPLPVFSTTRSPLTNPFQALLTLLSLSFRWACFLSVDRCDLSCACQQETNSSQPSVAYTSAASRV